VTAIAAACAFTGAAAQAITAPVAGGDPQEGPDPSQNGTFTLTVNGPSSVLSGQQGTFSVTINNQTGSDLGSFSVTNAFTPTPTDQTIGIPTGDGTCSPAGDASGITCSSLPANGSESFDATITAPVENASTPADDLVSATIAGDPGTADLQNLSVEPAATLALTNSAFDEGSVLSAGKVVAGNHVLYTIQVTNNGPSSAQNVSVTDTLSGILSGATMCSVSGLGPCTPSGPFTSPLTVGTLASGDSETWEIDALVPPGATKGAALNNSSTATTTTLDPNTNATGTKTATANKVIDTKADLAMVTSSVQDQGTVTVAGKAVAGNRIRYTMVVTNNGPSQAKSVAVKDVLPAQLTDLHMCTTPGCNPAGGVTPPASPTPLIPAFTLDPSASRTFVFEGLLPSSTLPATMTNKVTASSATTDPGPSANTSTTNTPVVTRADLATTNSVADMGTHTLPGKVVAGNPLEYTITIQNNGPSDAQAVKLADTMDALMTGPKNVCVVMNAPSCSPSTAFTSPVTVGTIHAGEYATVVIDAVLKPSALPPHILTNKAVASSTTTDQTPANNTANANSAIDTLADVQVVSETASSYQVLADGSLGSETLTVNVVNNGPSDARSIKASALDRASPSTLSSWVLESPPTIADLAPNTPTPMVITAHPNPKLGHFPPSPIVSGPLYATSSVTLKSTTKDWNLAANNVDLTALSDSNPPNGVEIDTVASPAQNPFAIPGDKNVILTWENSASDGGQPISDYKITVTGPDSQSVTVPFDASPSNACGAVAASDCYLTTITGLQDDNGAYTFDVQAENAVGKSDDSTTTATPSAQAQNAVVPINTTQTLTTCTTATPQTPVCVVYSIPGGAGGVFGAAGNVDFPDGLCGIGVNCLDGTAAQELGSLTGYNDPTQPLQETITWDSSLVDPSFYDPSIPQCANNSVQTDCYPNNIPIYYEDTFALLHCGLNGTTPFCDPFSLVNHTMFPVVPATFLNEPDASNLGKHFCSRSVAAGGAGDKNFARPKPTTGKRLYDGYNETSGDACIMSMNALGSASQNGANRDIQVKLNFDSDSDGIGLRH
jgi:uncharacterized repeat protein (TIGR01451 family)